MANTIYICLIAILIMYYLSRRSIRLFNDKKNLDYLKSSTKIPDHVIERLYNVFSRYSKIEHVVVESSVKYCKNQKNSQRFTIPILLDNFVNKNQIVNDEVFTNFVNDLIWNGLATNDKEISLMLVTFFKKHLKDSDCDLIAGYDWHQQIFKIYIDCPDHPMQCILFNLRTLETQMKIYRILPIDQYQEILDGLDQSSLNLILNLGLQESNCRHIYKTSDVISDVYHIILKTPLKFNNLKNKIIEDYFLKSDRNRNRSRCLKSQTSIVKVISLKKTLRIIENLTIYNRPYSWIDRMRQNVLLSNLFI